MCTNNIFNNINGYPLDPQQIKAAVSKSKNCIIIAGAGSGKSTTIVGKIKYLIEILNTEPEKILCISFTNEATNNIKKTIKNNCNNIEIETKTFHKLALDILEKNNINCNIVPSYYLEFIINEYFLLTQNINTRKNIIYFLKSKFYNYNEKEYEKLLKTDECYCLKKLIIKFINLYNSMYNSPTQLIAFLKNSTNYKETAFFKITLTIYLLYDQEKKSQNLIDFDDMINIATKTVKDTGKISKYKYIIIDEFQDTSVNRFDLIKEIINKTNANLTVVGDDFQSIYRFSGCTLNLFLNFPKILNDVEILKIENTYRNSQELIDVAGNFIMKNKNQIRKKLHSNKHISSPIKIIYENKYTLKKLLQNLDNSKYKNVLILSRNSFDIKKYINKDFSIDKDGYISYTKCQNITIRFLTVHKSKGLEADICIILNLINDRLGFPNQLENHKVLDILTNKEDFPFEEERRLFYVALTRSKNYVYLFTQKNNSSIFIKELLKDHKNYITIYK